MIAEIRRKAGGSFQEVEIHVSDPKQEGMSDALSISRIEPCQSNSCMTKGPPKMALFRTFYTHEIVIMVGQPSEYGCDYR